MGDPGPREAAAGRLYLAADGSPVFLWPADAAAFLGLIRAALELQAPPHELPPGFPATGIAILSLSQPERATALLRQLAAEAPGLRRVAIGNGEAPGAHLVLPARLNALREALPHLAPGAAPLPPTEPQPQPAAEPEPEPVREAPARRPSYPYRMLAIVAALLFGAWCLTQIGPPPTPLEATPSPSHQSTPPFPGVVEFPPTILRAPRTLSVLRTMVWAGSTVEEGALLLEAEDPLARADAAHWDALAAELRYRLKDGESRWETAAHSSPIPPHPVEPGDSPATPSGGELQRAETQLAALRARRIAKEVHLRRFLEAAQRIEVPPRVLRDLRAEIANLDVAIAASASGLSRLREPRNAAEGVPSARTPAPQAAASVKPAPPSTEELAELRRRREQAQASADSARARIPILLRAPISGKVQAVTCAADQECEAGEELLRILPAAGPRIVAWPPPGGLAEYPVGTSLQVHHGSRVFAAQVRALRAGAKGPELILRCPGTSLADGDAVLLLPPATLLAEDPAPAPLGPDG